MEEEYNQRTWFRVAYPKAGELSKRRWRVKPPYPGAPRWQCNVFYYWWEFLRRYPGYRETKGHGNGADPVLARVRGDWGDIHGVSFEQWWTNNGARLFGEPMPPRVHIVEGNERPDHPGPYVTVRIPLQIPYAKTDRRLRKLVVPLIKAHQRQVPKSLAQYRVLGKPVLPALHAYLTVYDLRQQHPDRSLAEIADLAGLTVKSRDEEATGDLTPAELKLLREDRAKDQHRKKAQEAYRHLKIAEALIAHAVDFAWPQYK